MNYRIIINDKPTIFVVVNSQSKEEAIKVVNYFEEVKEGEKLTLKEEKRIYAPSMFSNCIMPYPIKFSLREWISHLFSKS